MKNFWLLIFGLLFGLTACSATKKTLGLERSTPDETKVETRQPLYLPPNINELPN